jgi:hypothetical protein
MAGEVGEDMLLRLSSARSDAVNPIIKREGRGRCRCASRTLRQQSIYPITFGELRAQSDFAPGHPVWALTVILDQASSPDDDLRQRIEFTGAESADLLDAIARLDHRGEGTAPLLVLRAAILDDIRRRVAVSEPHLSTGEAYVAARVKRGGRVA